MSGAKMNLTVHESSEAGDKVMEVRLRLEEAVINIRYSYIDHSPSTNTPILLFCQQMSKIHIPVFKNIDISR